MRSFPGSGAAAREQPIDQSAGNADSNMKLSQARADSVMNDLERLGIPSGELTAQGFGEDNPAADNSTADGRQKNRRVTVGLAGER